LFSSAATAFAARASAAWNFLLLMAATQRLISGAETWWRTWAISWASLRMRSGEATSFLAPLGSQAPAPSARAGIASGGGAAEAFRAVAVRRWLMVARVPGLTSGHSGDVVNGMLTGADPDAASRR
jgi:hypothetical protein